MSLDSANSSSLSDIPRTYNGFVAPASNYYYNWNAATAETGKYNIDTYVDDSICPAGWQLPSISTPAGGKSWYDLFIRAYNYISVEGIQTADNSPLGTSNAASKAVRQNPINLSYGGMYGGAAGGKPTYLINGFFWNRIGANESTHAYDLLFNDSAIYPRHVYDIRNGFQVRCVLK